MNRVQCLRMKDMINDYLDGALENEDKRELFAHVESCEDCRAYFEDMKAIADVMAEDLLEELPEEFEAQLHQKLQQAAEKMEHNNVLSFKPSTKSQGNSIQKIQKQRWGLAAMKQHMPLISAAAVVVLAVGVSVAGLDHFKGQMNASTGGETAVATYDMAAKTDGANPEGVALKFGAAAPAAEPDQAQTQLAGAPEAVSMTADGAAAPEAAATRNMAKSAPEGAGSAAEPTYTTVSAEAGRKIVKSGNLTLESTKLDEAIKKLEAMVKENGGFIENANIGSAPPIYEPSGAVKPGTDHLRTAWYHVRIPAERFDDMMNKVAAIGKETNRGVGSQDITAQYVDTESQLKNLQTREASLRTLMGKTANVKDLLEVDRELTGVRTQIDSLISQKKSWDGQITLSSIDVNLNEVSSYTGDIAKAEGGMGSVIRKAFVDSINALLLVVSKTFYMVVVILPYVLLFGLVYGGLTKWRSRSKKENIKSESEVPLEQEAPQKAATEERDSKNNKL